MTNGAGAPAPGGMLQVLNLEQTLQREEALRAATSPVLPVEIESGLTGHIRKAWETAKMYRLKTDLRLLECLRARRGTYSPAEMANMQARGGSNIIWMDIADTKARSAAAWINDVIMPAGERAWSIEPSPIPELPDEIKQAVLEKAAFEARQTMVDQARAGKPWMTQDDFRTLTAEIGASIRDEALSAMRDNAAKRAERMESKLGEHMVEGGYRQAMAEFTDHFVSYPAAVLKGPYFQTKDCMVWLPGWNVKVENQIKMCWAAVNPFDCYPAPNAPDCQTGDFIERLRLRREHLYAMIGLPGYNEQAIRGALEDYRNGRNEAWLWSEMERRRYENDTIFDWLAPHGVIDALHYWGNVPGAYLMQWGMDPEDLDPVKEYAIDAILIGNYVIRAALNGHPLKQRPYRKACFSNVPGAFWGRSLFDLIKSSQKMCNATACAMADNMGMASGPMMWLYADRLAPGFTDINPEPWKIYQLSSSKTGSDNMSNPGIGYITTTSNAGELMAVFKFFEDRADMTSGVPKYFAGAADQAPQVARTLSMLMNAASKGLRQAISEIDLNVTEPTITDAYIYEMLYGADMGVKGDCNIVPRGAAAVLIKDAQLENRKQALSLAGNPLTMQIIGIRGYAELLRETYKMLEVPVDKIVPSDDALIQKEQAAEQAQLQAQQNGALHGPNPDKTAENAVKLAQQRTQRDLKAATIQKDLSVAAIKKGLPPPRGLTLPAQTALGLSNEAPAPAGA